LHLESDWRQSFTQRLAAVRPDERATIQYRLNAIDAALATHHPRDDPSVISTTFVETGQMLQRAEQSGSLLPVAGPVLVAVPGRGQQLLPCNLYLPEDHTGIPALRLLVLLPDAGGTEASLVRQAATVLAELRDVVILVPHKPSALPANPDNVLLDAAAAVLWAQSRFQTDTLLLAGLGEGAEDAIHFSLRRPELCQRVLLLVDADFAPWPGRDETALTRLLATHRNDIPYRVARRPGTAGSRGQTAALVTALHEAGFTVYDATNTAADRAVSTLGGEILRWLAEEKRPAKPAGR
jgi:hypothetical protein